MGCTLTVADSGELPPPLVEASPTAIGAGGSEPDTVEPAALESAVTVSSSSTVETPSGEEHGERTPSVIAPKLSAKEIKKLETIQCIRDASATDDARAEVIFENNKKFTRDFVLDDCCAKALTNVFRPFYLQSESKLSGNRVGSMDKKQDLRIASIIRPTCQGVAAIFMASAEILGVDGYKRAQFEFRQTFRTYILSLLEGCGKNDDLRNARLWQLAQNLGLELHVWNRDGKAERSKEPGATKTELQTRLREEGREIAAKNAEILREKEEFWDENEKDIKRRCNLAVIHAINSGRDYPAWGHDNYDQSLWDC